MKQIFKFSLILMAICVNFQIEPYTVVVSAHNHVPFVFTPSKYNTLHIHDRVISENTIYNATKIIPGKNVVIKSGVSLTLTASKVFEMWSNVICE